MTEDPFHDLIGNGAAGAIEQAVPTNGRRNLRLNTVRLEIDENADFEDADKIEHFVEDERLVGKLVLGVDVAAATSSTSSSTTPTVTPEIASITDSTGHVIRAQHTKYDPKVAKANKLGNAPTSAVIFSVNVPKTGQPAADYSLQVKGLNSTTGQYLVGFYLPGDVAGTGTVTKADIQTIKKDNGMTAQNSSYNFDFFTDTAGLAGSSGVSGRPLDTRSSAAWTWLIRFGMSEAWVGLLLR